MACRMWGSGGSGEVRAPFEYGLGYAIQCECATRRPPGLGLDNEITENRPKGKDRAEGNASQQPPDSPCLGETPCHVTRPRLLYRRPAVCWMGVSTLQQFIQLGAWGRAKKKWNYPRCLASKAVFGATSRDLYAPYARRFTQTAAAVRRQSADKRCGQTSGPRSRAPPTTPSSSYIQVGVDPTGFSERWRASALEALK
jgi:hypothetical protein